MQINLQRLGFGLFGILGAFALVPTANADLISPASFPLTSDHCDGGCLNGGSAGVVIVTDLRGGELQFQVKLVDGFGIINTGGGGGLGASFGFNLTNPPASVTYSNLTSGFSVVNGSGLGNLTAPNSNGGIHVDGFRSEEHTSELQSRRDLVCRLLLEKKKNHTAQDRRDALKLVCPQPGTDLYACDQTTAWARRSQPWHRPQSPSLCCLQFIVSTRSSN